MVLVVEYDGTNYRGSQRQLKAPTVQAELEKALQSLTGESIRIKTASRTDSGVHARGQVVSFRCEANHTDSTFIRGLNHYLPDDIAVRICRKVRGSYDVRRDAVSREYRYYILNRPQRSPMWRGRAWHVFGKLDIGIMQQACTALRGTRNFASFASRLARTNVSRMVRSISYAAVEPQGEMVVFRIIGRSFLPHQVRNTVGTLVRLGLGKMTMTEFYSIIEAQQPGLARPGAPARGLYLERVSYPEPFEGIINENL